MKKIMRYIEADKVATQIRNQGIKTKADNTMCV